MCLKKTIKQGNGTIDILMEHSIVSLQSSTTVSGTLWKNVKEFLLTINCYPRTQ